MADVVEFQLTTPEPFWTNIQHPENFARYIEPAMSNIMDEFKAEMEVYAPESEANFPGRVDADGRPMGYYERGRGWWYPIMRLNTIQLAGRLAGAGLSSSRAKFGKTRGVINLRRVSGVVGYKLIASSQQMGERWVIAIQTSDEDVIGTLFNGASYSSLVQGPSQTRLHASRDWSNIDDIWNGDAMQSTLDKEIGAALDQFLAD